MTNLVNQLPESTFGDLLTTTNNGQGLPISVPVPLQDGLGNNSPITMSQNTVNFNTTGGNSLQINGTPLIVSASQLNGLFLVGAEIINTTALTQIWAIHVDPYDSLVPHGVSVEFVINISRQDSSKNGFACTPTPFYVFARQSSVALEIVGSSSGTLSNVGMTSPQFQFVTAANILSLQVSEGQSDIMSTSCFSYYRILEQF